MWKMVVNNSFNKLQLIFFVAMLEIFSGCSAKTTQADEINTVHRFLKEIRQHDTSSFFEMLSPDLNQVDTEGVLGKAKQINVLLHKYYLTDQAKWSVDYDTLGSIVKYKNITVPFCKTKNDTVVIAKISFSFDHTRKYLPSDIISVFYVDISSEVPSDDFIDTTRSMIELK